MRGRYAEAAILFRQEAAARRAMGDFGGAKAEEIKADRYTSDLRLFAHLPGWRPARVRSQPLAKWEPAYGCYVGAFLDRDERLGQPFTDENYQSHRDPAAFAERTGKKLASAFCYLSYGQPFPARWAAWLRRQNVAPHLAWEPNDGLAAVRDDDYLRRFADDAARANCPIFLRFASEMNGDWTRYGGDPLRYKQAWGTVYRVMAERAPNVALVWCVNHIPEKNVEWFYPGDRYVDWVGVNFYSVPFHDNDARRPGLDENPADMARHVYRLYASRKPIMVCEYGASHLSKVDRRARPAWAGDKIAQMYAALPRLYPRIKAINIFDNDNLTYATPGRALNNYSVTDDERVQAAYADAVAPDYFLSDVWNVPWREPAGPTAIAPLSENLVVRPGILRVSAWARCYAPRPTVHYVLDGREVFRSQIPGAYPANLNLSRPGPHRLVAVVLDDKGRVAARTEKTITVR